MGRCLETHSQAGINDRNLKRNWSWCSVQAIVGDGRACCLPPGFALVRRTPVHLTINFSWRIFLTCRGNLHMEVHTEPVFPRGKYCQQGGVISFLGYFRGFLAAQCGRSTSVQSSKGSPAAKSVQHSSAVFTPCLGGCTLSFPPPPQEEWSPDTLACTKT